MWIKLRSFFNASRGNPEKSAADVALPSAVGRARPLPGTGNPVEEPVDDRIEQAFMGLVLGVHSPQNAGLNEFERKTLKAFAALLDSNLADNRLIPRLPSILPRLMSYFRDPSATSRELADLIGRDIISLSEVIRLANSPFYRRASEARSLEQAILVLGQRGLRQLVANMLVRPIFSERQGHFSAIAGILLWEQSEKTALIATALARQEKGDEFNAYLAGISSNIGLLIGCRVLDAMFDGSQTPSSLAFRIQWLEIARKLTARVARAWEFPDAVCTVLEQQGRLDPSRLPDEGMRLYSAQRLGEFHCLQNRGRLPAGDLAQSGSRIADDRVYTLAMDILARLEGRKD